MKPPKHQRPNVPLRPAPSSSLAFPRYAPIVIGIALAAIASWAGHRVLSVLRALPGRYDDDGAN